MRLVLMRVVRPAILLLTTTPPLTTGITISVRVFESNPTHPILYGYNLWSVLAQMTTLPWCSNTL